MRKHCIISMSRTERKWFWHTELQPGTVLSHCASPFKTFDDCVSDAHSHGFNHIEVPVLDGTVPSTPHPPVAEHPIIQAATDDTAPCPAPGRPN